MDSGFPALDDSLVESGMTGEIGWLLLKKVYCDNVSMSLRGVTMPHPNDDPSRPS